MEDIRDRTPVSGEKRRMTLTIFASGLLSEEFRDIYRNAGKIAPELEKIVTPQRLRGPVLRTDGHLTCSWPDHYYEWHAALKIQGNLFLNVSGEV
jgi:hypothetical protein